MKAWIVTDEDGLKAISQDCRFVVFPNFELAKFHSYGMHQPTGVNILTDQELEQIKEQVAREAIIRGWEEACKWYVRVDERDFHKELVEKQRTFNDYWQQKNKETPNKLGGEG